MLFKPSQRKASTGQNVVFTYGLAGAHRQLVIPARQVGARLGFSGMNREKILAGNTVAIGEDQISRGNFKNRFIENPAFAKTFIFLPDVLYVETRFGPHPIDQLASVVGGPVIGNYDFKVAMTLSAVTPENFLQPLRRIISGDNNR